MMTAPPVADVTADAGDDGRLMVLLQDTDI